MLISFNRDDIQSALRKLQDNEREGKSLELTACEVAACISAIHIANLVERLVARGFEQPHSYDSSRAS
jgi:hypothetical protein